MRSAWCGRRALVIAVVILLGRTPGLGDEQEVPKALAPHEAVREGNRLLAAGDAQRAIELYRHAEAGAPSAREIAFDQGLALFQLGRYAEAREKFREAASGKADRLADDALYSEGTTYHAEALSESADPQTAVSHLESAMQRYQNVLANRPDHQAAREANFKAGMLRRLLKEQMQEQQQQQSEQPDGENQEQQEQDEPPDQKRPQEDQQKEEQSQAQQQQQEQQEQASEGEQQEEGSEAEQREQISREQAERKLRELMQAVRQRKKDRREPVRVAPIKPVEKDW